MYFRAQLPEMSLKRLPGTSLKRLMLGGLGLRGQQPVKDSGDLGAGNVGVGRGLGAGPSGNIGDMVLPVQQGQLGAGSICIQIAIAVHFHLGSVPAGRDFYAHAAAGEGIIITVVADNDGLPGHAETSRGLVQGFQVKPPSVE